MPRKKISSTDVTAETPTPAPTDTTESKPAAKRTRSKAQDSSADSPVRAAAPESKRPSKSPTKKAQDSSAGLQVRAAAPQARPTSRPAAKKETADSSPDPTVQATAPAAKEARPAAKRKVTDKVEIPTAEPVPTADPKPRTLFGKRPTAPPAEPVAEKTEDAPETLLPPIAAEAEPAKKPRRGKAAKPEVDVFAGIEDDMPMPTFRSRTANPQIVPKGETDHADEELAPRKSKRKRRRDLQDVEITVTGPVPVDLPPPSFDSEIEESLNPVFRKRDGQPTQEKPKPASEKREPRGRAKKEQPTKEAEKPFEKPRRVPPPPKPLIAVPDDAPQVVLRENVPTLVRNHRVYPPIWFFASTPDARRTNTVLEELEMAANAGVHVHSHLIEFEIVPGSAAENAKHAAFVLSQTLKIDPDAQVIFRLVFIAPRGWQSTYSSAVYTTKEGNTAEPSVCDDNFWNVAKDCLAEFVRSLRQLDQRDSILGVHLERGEWFFSSREGFDESQAARNKFRDWARERYSDDEVALRANWFDGNVRFESIEIPRQGKADQGEKFVRSSRKQRKFVDYHLFLADATVHRIGELAYAVKEASEGYFLVGCSYGYTFEWSHPASGHLALGKLLRTPEIDFIAGPPSYRNREPGSAAPFPGPIDSFALNGKLFISEEDFKTSLSTIGAEPDDFNPMIKTPQALDSVHWRGAGAALAHGSGVSWMDLWGNGWLKTHSVWDRAARIQKAMVLHMAAPLEDPEVVVFIDERALAYLVDEKAFELLVQTARESVLRAGVNAGFYLLSDLAHRERFPEAKAYIFLNAWDIRPDLRSAIKTRLQRDNKVLFWLYSAGLFDAGRESLERAREVTGIALKPQPFHSRSGSTILNRRHPLCEAFPANTIAGTQQLEPSYFAIPEEAQVLGEYSQTGLPSFVVKDFQPDGEGGQAWTSVFLGEPVVNPAMIRALAQMAGAHVYNFSEDVVHVRPPFLTIHCSGPGQRVVTLPKNWAAFNLLSGQWVTLESTNVRFTATDGSTHVFLVGTREEVEELLKTRPEDLLRMETLPPRPDNTIRQDSFAFDVPVMKLDEWIEGGEPDEIADEWFLRPTALADVAESSPEAETERVGRRRRRRGRGGNGRGGSEESNSARFEPSGTPEPSLNVMFRKRD